MTDNITNKGCCGNPSQCWEPCGDLGKSLLHTRASSKQRKQAVRDTIRRHNVNDNSLKFTESDFDRMADMLGRIVRPTDPGQNSICAAAVDYLRAAAAQAREIAELRQAVDNAGSIIEAMNRNAESAESANRALQDEVDRLNRAVDEVVGDYYGDEGGELSFGEQIKARAIAYTGTEPQEGTKP